jgi:hypothetical protein
VTTETQIVSTTPRTDSVRPLEGLNSGTVPEIKHGRGGRRPGAGRPPIGGVSRRVLAEATGYSERRQVRIAEHVRLAEKYPVLQRPGWLMGSVLRFGALLETLPEADRATVVASVAGETPREAIAFLEIVYRRHELAPSPTEEAVYESVRAVVNGLLEREPAPSMADVANALARLLARARAPQRGARG